MRELPRLIFTVLSLVMAYGAQMLLEGTLPASWFGRWPASAQSNLAYGLYVGALIIFGLAALPMGARWRPRAHREGGARRRLDEPDARIMRPGGRRDESDQRTISGLVPLGRWLGVSAAAALGLAAAALWWQSGESALVRWLWGASLLVLVASQLPVRLPRRKITIGWRVLAELLLVLCLLAGAFVLRYYDVEIIPSDFHGDMASHGLEARKLLAGEQSTLFSTMWAEIPTIAFVPAALSMSVFGNDLFGLRMTSVIGGTLSVLGVYLLARELFSGRSGRRIAIASAGFLTVSYVHIHFSRIAEYMDPWPFALFSLYLLIRGLKRDERLSFVGSGLLVGASLQMYYSGRIVPLVVLAFLLYLLLLRRDMLAGNWTGLVLLGLGALLTLGPMIPFYIRHPYDFLIRSRSVFLFHPPVMEHLMGKYQVGSVGAVVREQFKRSLLMFHESIDSSTQFGLARPMLDPFTSPLLVLGVGVALRGFRKAGLALATIWLVLILVVGSALTNNAPFWPRLVGILPAATLLAAVAAERIWTLVEDSWGDTASALFGLLLLLCFVFLGLNNWQTYHSAVEDNARPRARIGRYISGLDEDVNVCLLTDPYELSVREIAFLAFPRSTYDLPSQTKGDQLGACPGPQRAFILTTNHLDVLPELRELFPEGVIAEHPETDGSLVFVSYLVGG